jgi:hypothetical protein
MGYLIIPFVSIGAFYVLWTFFLAYASVKRAYEEKSAPNYVIWLSSPIILIGLIIDIIVNVTIMTFIMVELPKEYTVSTRIHRHRVESSGYRKFVAELLTPFLNSFDKGHV